MIHSKVFLIGFMGSGKSTTGKILAEKTGIKFIDSDGEIEKNEGKSIAEIFEKHGESYFRNLEKNLIKQLISTDEKCVVSTGGGLPCHQELMDELNKNGTTVYLKCNAETLLTRLSINAAERPLLKGRDLASFIAEKLNMRVPVYEKSKIIVNADGAVNDVAEEIFRLLN